MKITTIPYSDKGSFLNARKKLITRDQLANFSSHTELSSQEMLVDQILERLKNESKALFLKHNIHPATASIVRFAQQIKNNPLYDLITIIPKGILQHIHSSTSCDPIWIVEKAQTENHCFVYWQDDNKEIKGRLKFFARSDVPKGYVPASSVSGQELYDLLVIPKNSTCSSMENEKNLALCYERLRWFTAYEPIFEDYYTQALLSMIKDNLQGAELRLDMPDCLYDIKGNIYDPGHMVKLIRSALLAARQVGGEEHFKLKIILSTLRSENKLEMIEYLRTSFMLKQKHKGFIGGYDISGNNNWPKHFRSYMDLTENFRNLRLLENEFNLTMPLFFHDSENFSAKDQGVYDAVLLECKRMGMSLNLFKFPELEKVVRERDIHIEILPISNQAEGYVPDLRVHPACGYLTKGINCTISSGDPGLFGYSGVSPDFWAAVISWDLGLKEIKQLIINSYISSNLDGNFEDMYSEKGASFRRWSSSWEEFIQKASQL